MLRSLLGQKPVIGDVEKLKSSLVLKAKVKGKIVISKFNAPQSQFHMESGILNKLLFVLCWFSIITLDDLNITETRPGLYHHCSRIKCCANFMVIKVGIPFR